MRGRAMGIVRFAVSAGLALGVAIIAACSTGPAMANPQAASISDSYRLGTGDEVKVTVFGEADLSGPVVVDGQGAITMPLIGQVEVKGLTFAETGSRLEAKLKDGWLRDPKVTVEMTKGRPYYILGEVNRAGEYPFTSGLTVMNAIAAAGDFTYRADKKKIMVTNADSSEEREVKLTPATPVQPGDRIRVLERYF
ncbi:MAG TPA: polysaccharide biosynthesis/export family protein [Hyphomonadaceae bacterium]|nr:polysaccharide biosynthesis/export family protein [Hyphomonadaceae bacterium]